LPAVKGKPSGSLTSANRQQLIPNLMEEQPMPVKKTENLPERAERRYRAFLEFLPDPVFVFNLDATVSYLNPAFVRIFGWTADEDFWMDGRGT